ncbi:glycerol-3-phosphate responsive antiterminator [Halonatronum saccharophilum]|uniref:glycerol-3-phosphate responsive antiterminator n=1 Tax=Halonatronum saccharophilum TaxID=150060 RepID=UPI0004AC66B1|nr:glycerol-3-phosphate responsive antiterminator [Halonatronum saccharophilum]
MYLEYVLNKKPIIAAIKDLNDLERVPIDKINVLFVLRGEISNLAELVNKAIELDTLVFLHVDMIKGIGNDKEAIKYLAHEIGVDGIVTTKSYLINCAKKEGLITIQRLFLLDSESLRTGINIVNSTKPDLVEVLPGLVIPELIDDLKEKLDIPIIAGGLIKEFTQLKKLLKEDIIAISTSQKELWDCDFD